MYSKALREVSEILDHVDTELTNKISSDFIELIIENADWSYDFSYDESKSFEEQNLSEEAKTILAMIYVQNFAEEEEKIELVEKMKENELLIEEEKNIKYNVNNLFENNNIENKNENILNNIEVGLIQISEEKWYKKIFRKIKNFFRRK